MAAEEQERGKGLEAEVRGNGATEDCGALEANKAWAFTVSQMGSYWRVRPEE